MQSRPILLFENSIKSDFTRRTYNSCIKQFVKYYKLKNNESILKIPDAKLQVMLEDYLFYMKQHVKVSSIRNFFAALELFLMVNDKGKINSRKLHKMFPEDDNRSGKKPWTTKHIQIMLESTKSLRTKALIHLLASTGCRIGATPDLKIRNLVDMPNDCMAVLFYESSKEEYWGFLTPEASQYMKSYLMKRKRDGEHLDQDNPLFRENYRLGIAKPKKCSHQNIRWLVHRTVTNSGIVRERDGKRFDIQTNHGFRKRFNTILKLNKNINPAITEKLMAHKINLDGVYLTPTRDELFEEFKKGIEDLAINDSERLRQKNLKLQKEKSELQKEIEENQIQKDEVARQGQAIDHLLDEINRMKKEKKELEI